MFVRLLIILLTGVAAVGVGIAEYGDHHEEHALVEVGLLYFVGPSFAAVAIILMVYGAFNLIFPRTV